MPFSASCKLFVTVKLYCSSERADIFAAIILKLITMLNLRFVFLAVVLFAVSLNYSCKKDAENIIDCLFEPANFTFDHTIDTQDPKKVSFTITYSGEHTLDNSNPWDFGDGTTQTISGTTTTHTYSSAGTYIVKVQATTRNGDAYCTVELSETVTIN